jgi:hypothetical protein
MKLETGRPVEYADREIVEVWRRHATGESLIEICSEKGMPSFSLVYERIAESPDLGRIAASAREEYAHRLVGQSIDIADKDIDAPRARNRIAARQWFASKYARQTFGDKVELNVTGSVSVGAALEEARRRVRPISDLTQAHDPHVIDLQAETVSEATDSQSAPEAIDPLS